MSNYPLFSKLHISNFRQFKEHTVQLGNYITIFVGANGTGKSTILGLLGHCAELKKEEGVPLNRSFFRADFSHSFKASKAYQRTGYIGKVINSLDNEISMRVTWPKDGDKTSDRFRIVCEHLIDGKKFSRKWSIPVLYMGLSRLYPIGESQDVKITSATSLTDEEFKEFEKQYKHLLHMEDITIRNIDSVKKDVQHEGVAITTENYDHLSNSAGQDNIGQILLALFSFKKLKKKFEAEGKPWKGGLLLIDELDATLHSFAQHKLLKLFMKEAKKTGLQIMFTTHSNYLIQRVYEEHNLENNTLGSNRNVILNYLSTEYGSLAIKANPPKDDVIGGMNVEIKLEEISTTPQTSEKILLITEDAEARWFLQKLLGKKYETYNVPEVVVGCDSLISLFTTAASFLFTEKTIVVFDGDLDTKQKNKLANSKFNVNYIPLLGSNQSPEKVFCDFLNALPVNDSFWQNPRGYTKRFHIDEYQGIQEKENGKLRDAYKEWFKKHLTTFEKIKLYERWLTVHQKERNKFTRAFNKLVKKIETQLEGNR